MPKTRVMKQMEAEDAAVVKEEEKQQQVGSGGQRLEGNVPTVPTLVFRPTSDLSKMRNQQNESITLYLHPSDPQFPGGQCKCAIYFANGTVDSPSVDYSDERELYEKLSGMLQETRESEEKKVVQLQRQIAEYKREKLGSSVLIGQMESRLSALQGGVVYAAQHIRKITDRKDLLLNGRISGTKAVSMPDFVTVLPFSQREELDLLNKGGKVDSLKDRIRETFGESTWIERVLAHDVRPFDQVKRQYSPEWVILG